MKKDFEKYNLARILRQKGKSIRMIANILQISSSSASLWCRNIYLTEKQRELLARRGKSIKILKEYARIRHKNKLLEDKNIFSKAKEDINNLNKNELFLAGLALYWAEGFKSEKEQQVGFCNSDPRMIKFIIKWFGQSLGILQEDFILRTEFNISHKHRTEEISNYWSALTKIPLTQFNKPYFQKAQWHRNYDNKEKYYGILRIKIRRSSKLLVQIKGWIAGLDTN